MISILLTSHAIRQRDSHENNLLASQEHDIQHQLKNFYLIHVEQSHLSEMKLHYV